MSIIFVCQGHSVHVSSYSKTISKEIESYMLSGAYSYIIYTHNIINCIHLMSTLILDIRSVCPKPGYYLDIVGMVRHC